MQSGLTLITESVVLRKGCLPSRTRVFVRICSPLFRTDKENSVEGSGSKADYVLLVDDDEPSLCEAKMSSVMHKVGQVLPQRGIELSWFRGQPLIPQILANVSTLFLSVTSQTQIQRG